MFPWLKHFTLKLCFRSIIKLNYTESLQFFSSYSCQDLLNNTPEESGLLITRFAKHIAVESHKFDAVVPRTISYFDFFPVHDISFFRQGIQNISTDQLPSLITLAFGYRCNSDPMKFVQVLNDIDLICLQRLSTMDNSTLLRTLYSLLFLIPENITRTLFFTSAIPRIIHGFQSNIVGKNTSKEKFVQVCFYVGLIKSAATHEVQNLFQNFLNKYLDSYTDYLSKLDTGIVSSAIYKTSTCIRSPLFLNRIQEDLLVSPVDNALLTTFVKTLRLQKVKSEKVCEHLKNYCESSGLQLLTLSGLTHIFAYFAESMWDDLITQKISTEFIKRIKMFDQFKSHNTDIRAKDICTFLWCCTQLDIPLYVDDMNYLESIVLNKLEKGEFQKFPDQLVDCALNLWILGIKSRAIVREVIKLKGKYFSFAKYTNVHRKVDNRFLVLQSAVAIEFPLWIPSVKGFEEDCPAPPHLLKIHQYLNQYAQQISSEKDIGLAAVVCPVRGINIPNIRIKFLKSDRKICLQVLEEDQLLKISQKPVAILRLKENLLKTVGYEVINIRIDDLHKSYPCLKELLLKGER